MTERENCTSDLFRDGSDHVSNLSVNVTAAAQARAVFKVVQAVQNVTEKDQLLIQT